MYQQETDTTPVVLVGESHKLELISTITPILKRPVQKGKPIQRRSQCRTIHIEEPRSSTNWPRMRTELPLCITEKKIIKPDTSIPGRPWSTQIKPSTRPKQRTRNPQNP
jgi:hypothetical protein